MKNVKTICGIVFLAVFLVAGCATNGNVSVPEKGYHWVIYKPPFPKDVPLEVYEKLWAINLKTINAGKYDFNAYNFGAVKFLEFDESALSDDFTFAGVCMNYADYYIFLLEHDEFLRDLYNQNVIKVNTSPSHKWIEYHTKKNKYIIDPTWCDCDFEGEPVGMYANNARLAEDIVSSSAGDEIITAMSEQWFFRNVKSITRKFDKKAHGL